MKSLWTFGLERMMNAAGQECKTVIDGEPYYFQGALDQESQLVQDDRGVQWVEHGFRLSVLRDIATKIPKDTLHTICIGGEEYTVRNVLLKGDGETCEIYLTKVNAFSNPCNTTEVCQ